MMKTGLCISTPSPVFAGRALRTAARLGCGSVEMPVYGEVLDGRPVTGAAREVRLAGIPVDCVSASMDTAIMVDGRVPHQERVRHAVARADAAFTFARDIGSPNVRLSFPCPDLSIWFQAAGKREKQWDALGSVIYPVLDRAKALGLRILLEPQAREICPDARAILYLFRELGDRSDACGICHDPANLWILGYGSGEFLDQMDSLPAVVHVKDVQRAPSASAQAEGEGWRHYGPQRPVRYRGLGRGDLDWPSILQDLIDRGFEGPFLIEPQLGDELEETIERDWRWLRQQLALLHAEAPGAAESRGTEGP